ncbi:MAG: HlyD family secretion protein [Anaerolineales bacterium]
MSRSKHFARILCLAILFLAACSPETDGTQAPDLIPVDSPALVNASGLVVPQKESLLSVTVGGIVDEVLVEQGDQVDSGQVLVKLAGSEEQLAAVASAEVELLSAQLALDALTRDTDLLAAQALKSAEDAERALEDLNDPELRKAQASQAVADAQKALADADRNLAILTNPPSQNVIDQAQGNILLAEKKFGDTLDQLEDIERQYKQYSANKNLPPEIRGKILTRLRRALKGLEIKRSQEQLALDHSQTRFNELLEPPDPHDVQVAEANLAAAQAVLNQAESELEDVLAGPQAGEVALLEAQIQNGHQDYETYRHGPDPEDVALAEVRLASAEAQLAAARAAIADRQLSAPFDGVVSAVHVSKGEWVAPGSPVLLLGNLDQLHVETTDLGEYEVAQIMVGDPALITFDALPGVILQGAVSRIAPKPTGTSEMDYPVVIELDEIPAALRWGMTASVDIEIE